MLFHYFILNHVLNVFIQVKNGRVLKNDLEIDTIDNDDEKDSFEVGKHDKISKYPLQVQQHLEFQKSCTLTEKIWNLKKKAPTPPLLASLQKTTRLKG